MLEGKMKLFLEVKDSTKKNGLAHYAGAVQYLDQSPLTLMQTFNEYKDKPENNFVDLVNMS